MMHSPAHSVPCVCVCVCARVCAMCTRASCGGCPLHALQALPMKERCLSPWPVPPSAGAQELEEEKAGRWWQGRLGVMPLGSWHARFLIAPLHSGNPLLVCTKDTD